MEAGKDIKGNGPLYSGRTIFQTSLSWASDPDAGRRANVARLETSVGPLLLILMLLEVVPPAYFGLIRNSDRHPQSQDCPAFENKRNRTGCAREYRCAKWWG